ncbi:MAG TPA: hypothetical protein VF077_09375 [Nitrospiraceae bacterium]
MIQPQPFVGCTVTLSATPQSISSLIKPLYPRSNNQVAAHLVMTADPSNAGVAVLVGDSTLSTSNFGESLDINQQFILGPFNVNSIPLANIFVRGASGTPKLNVTFVTL